LFDLIPLAAIFYTFFTFENYSSRLLDSRPSKTHSKINKKFPKS